MKKLIIILIMLIGWMSGNGQDHSDYVFNFRLPGTSGANFDFSPLDDSVAVAKLQGWNVLVIGFYNISHYNSANEYKPIIENFDQKDSSIIISFFKEGDGFDFDIRVSSGNNGKDELIASEIHNYLIQNHSGYVGQNIINNIAKSLTFVNSEILDEAVTDACTAGRSSQAIINSKFVTNEDAFFISLSGVPILVPAGSKVDFFTCNAVVSPNGPINGVSVHAKGVLKSFTYKENLYSARANIVNGSYEFGGYKYSVLSSNKKNVAISYVPHQLFKDGGSIYLVFVTECEMLKIKEFEHINSKVSEYGNKHGGPVVAISTIYPNFVREFRLQADTLGNFVKVLNTTIVSEIEVTLNCPPPLKLDGIKLNEAINGATYIEILYDKSVTLVHTSLGHFAIYDIVTSSEPAFMKYNETNKEWVFIEVNNSQFIDDLRQLVSAGVQLGAKVAIFAATFAASGGGAGVALAVDVFAAGAMYAIEGDPDNLVMDLLLVPLGAVGEGVSMIKDASKVADAMKDASKFDEVTSAAYQLYKKEKAIKAAKNFKIKNSDGTWLDWSSIKPDIQKELGDDYAKFCDDFLSIAQNSNKHLDLLQCVVGGAIRGENNGSRSGACNYRLLKAWKLLAKHPQISTDISSIQAVAKLREAGIPDADVIKIIDNVAKAGVKCKTCASGNITYKLFDEVLDDIHYAKVNFTGKTGFDKVWNEIMNDANGNTIGAIWVLDVARNKNLGGAVNEFGATVGTGAFKCDIKVGNTKFIECKSWASLHYADEAQFGKQFANMLDNISNINDMVYYWAREKPNTSQFTEILKKHIGILNNNSILDEAKRILWFGTDNVTNTHIINFVTQHFNTIIK